MEKNTDKSFDDLAAKFEKNIYGTSKGKLRHDLLMHYLIPIITSKDKPLRALDAGGGTGEMAKALAGKGLLVTLNDVSADALELAKSKCSEFETMQFQCSPLQEIRVDEPYDLIACHAVMEWLEKPLDAVNHLLSLLKPGGHLSLSFYNHDARLFGNVVYGNFDFVLSGMNKRNQVRLTPHSPLKPKIVLEELSQLNVEFVHEAGIRCFHDYVKEKHKVDEMYEELFQLELRYGREEPFKWIGKYFHIILRKLG